MQCTADVPLVDLALSAVNMHSAMRAVTVMRWFCNEKVSVLYH